MTDAVDNIENQHTPALASEERGRWIPDPDDPELEVWEAYDSEVVESATDGEVEDVPETEDMAPMKTPLWSMEGRPNRCTAHKKNGERCKRAAIAGGTVCRVHGGAAPAVQAAARVRLAMAADRMAANLLKIAVSDDAPVNVKLAAIKDALDRAGLTSKTAVEVSVDPKPFEQLLTGMATLTGGSRAASRAERGVADVDDADAAWIAEELAASNVIDVEVEDPAPRPRPSEEPAITDASPDTGLMDMETALAQLRATTPPPAPTGKRRGRTR